MAGERVSRSQKGWLKGHQQPCLAKESLAVKWLAKGSVAALGCERVSRGQRVGERVSRKLAKESVVALLAKESLAIAKDFNNKERD